MTHGTGRGSTAGADGQPGTAERVEEARRRAHCHCGRHWSKDGRLKAEGMVMLRVNVELVGSETMYGNPGIWFGRPMPSEDERRADFAITMQYLDKAVREHADSAKKKEAHVRLLIKYCMTFSWRFAAEMCKEALIGLCNEGGVWRTYAPKALQSNITKYGSRPAIEGGMDPVVLCADVLRQAGMDASHVYKKYWRSRDVICAEFVAHLLKEDGRHARRVASIGLDLFPGSRVLATWALKAIDPADEDAELKTWCRVYAAGLNPEYYEMAKESSRWNAERARRLAGMLAVQREFDAELEVLTEAGLDSEMLAALMNDGTMHAVSEYKGMAGAHPDQYYAICRRLATDLIGAHGGADEAQRVGDIKKCLQVMGGIPGHRAEFEEFCGKLLTVQSIDAELAGVIRDAANDTGTGTFSPQ